jgi:hypothetical protein
MPLITESSPSFLISTGQIPYDEASDLARFLASQPGIASVARKNPAIDSAGGMATETRSIHSLVVTYVLPAVMLTLKTAAAGAAGAIGKEIITAIKKWRVAKLGRKKLKIMLFGPDGRPIPEDD